MKRSIVLSLFMHPDSLFQDCEGIWTDKRYISNFNTLSKILWALNCVCLQPINISMTPAVYGNCQLFSILFAFQSVVFWEDSEEREICRSVLVKERPCIQVMLFIYIFISLFCEPVHPSAECWDELPRPESQWPITFSTLSLCFNIKHAN